ncbi:ubiquitin domain-containing protein DSK2 NDAI_0K00440 [Naumovozyma dairenensis CBS 421]|uniref:Ubiquitin domain-containing protein DSK2 n=1 Tax=Naumovozyma dairenensis (strain ATCC 10597 / BCRC 20456 / CBS 421 / NBRC 0211 / NRRL Y-12639) TaxID=1071378 RepID=G0WHH4_NAUDC|nr:hypothetical protein NDAI_0K00440 [Naumovozyma dairenensis CBS 421]CCD27235.1 hypothetical protein NDAI_0K00440 [Naumovozyma dairenensis CBS 421]
MSTISIHIKSGQNNWQVSIDTTASIATLKDEIAKVSEIPATNQRLIYSGKILKDDQNVDFYNIQDGHSVHLVRSGKKSTPTPATTNTTTNASNNTVPSNISAGQTGGFNPLADLTSARYAGYNLNLPSADAFGPDGGMNQSGTNPDEFLSMLDNPIVQSQMNEMLSNPQMIDFMIQSNPQLQAMGPQARQMFQSPMFRQMLTNPDMIRQSMQLANMMGMGPGARGSTNATDNAASSFPAPGGDDIINNNNTNTNTNTNTNNDTNDTATSNNDNANNNASSANTQNPFASLFNPTANNDSTGLAPNPFLAMLNNAGAGSGTNNAGATGTLPPFDPSMFASLFGGAGAPSTTPQQQDTRPPEERYETQLRQLNDMGFFDFDRNIAALRRTGGSVEAAVNALLNGDV